MKQAILILITLIISGTSRCQLSVNHDTSLYKAYEPLFPIGAAINPSVDLASEQRKSFIAQQYNCVTPENQMKPKQIHPKENEWNWKPADEIVEFARNNKMKVRGHTLVWQQNIPYWMIYKNGKIADSAFLFQQMQSHIVGMMNRYSEHVYCWDVVNEAISDIPNELYRKTDTLYMIAGESYIEQAFRFAREADPNAILFYNDYRFSNPSKRKKIYELMKRMLQKGVPIDGIGIQSHYVPNEITPAYLQETIDMFHQLGLQVQITELDVSVYNYRDKASPDSDPADEVYSMDRMKVQSEMYRMLFDVYALNADKITGVTFWGTSDMRKNYRTYRIKKMDYPFLFNEFCQPKQIYFDVITIPAKVLLH